MEREGTEKGRIMGKGGVREGRERGKELRREGENGSVKEEGWRDEGREVWLGWAREKMGKRNTSCVIDFFSPCIIIALVKWHIMGLNAIR